MHLPRVFVLLTAVSLVMVLPGNVGVAQAVTCPTVDASGVVTPAPTSTVDWSGCNLSGAILRSANLNDAKLIGANLSGANLSGAYLNATADLSSANLTGANLRGADLTGANLTSANLTSANFNLASMYSVILTNASVTCSNTGILGTGMGFSPSPALPTGWSFAGGTLSVPILGCTPGITSISPVSGFAAGGTLVTITGTGFTSGPSLGVTFAGVAATSVTVVSATQLTVRTPESEPGQADVAVTNGAGLSAKSWGAYTYTEDPLAFTSISPSNGSPSGGTAVTITGSGFVGYSVVLIGGNACTSKVLLSSRSISCVTPVGADGAATVTVQKFFYSPSPSVTGPGAFTYGSGGGGGSGGGSSLGGGSPTPVVTPTPTPSSSPSVSAASVTPSSPVRLDPVVTAANPNIPVGGVPAGGSVLLVGGVPVPVTVQPNSTKDPVALVFSAEGVSMRLEGIGAGGDPLGLTSGQALILQSQQPGTRSGGVRSSGLGSGALGSGLSSGGGVRSRLGAGGASGPTAALSGSGFAPGSPVRVFILPGTFLGEVVADARGEFSGSVPVPDGIVPGVHTLQANGFAPDLSVRSLSVGALVKPAVAKAAAVAPSRAVARVRFAPLSSSLTAAGRLALDGLAARAGTGVVRTLAVGFVDGTGAEANDAALSRVRAGSVVAYLRSIGVTGPAVARGGGVSAASGGAARRVTVAIRYRN